MWEVFRLDAEREIGGEEGWGGGGAQQAEWKGGGIWLVE